MTVVDRRDEVEAESETRAAVAVTLGQNAKDFEACNDMLDDDALA